MTDITSIDHPPAVVPPPATRAGRLAVSWNTRALGVGFIVVLLILGMLMF